MNVDDALESWENEGGPTANDSFAGFQTLKGTINQVDWAERIRSQANAEFDRVAKALESAAGKRSEKDRSDIVAMIEILEDKRIELVSNDSAGYFIHDWQELRWQVRDLITKDARYLVIKARR